MPSTARNVRFDPPSRAKTVNMSVRNSASSNDQAPNASSTSSAVDALATALVTQSTNPMGQLDAQSLGQSIRYFVEHDPTFARQTLEAVGNQLFEAGRLGDAAALHQGYSEPDLSAGEAAAHGVAGAVGRESAVQSLMLKAYQAGVSAPQGSFDGTVYRSLKTEHEQGALDITKIKGSVGRYNAASESLIYTSPSRPAAQPPCTKQGLTQNQGVTRWRAAHWSPWTFMRSPTPKDATALPTWQKAHARWGCPYKR